MRLTSLPPARRDPKSPAVTGLRTASSSEPSRRLGTRDWFAKNGTKIVIAKFCIGMSITAVGSSQSIDSKKNSLTPFWLGVYQILSTISSPAYDSDHKAFKRSQLENHLEFGVIGMNLASVICLLVNSYNSVTAEMLAVPGMVYVSFVGTRRILFSIDSSDANDKKIDFIFSNASEKSPVEYNFMKGLVFFNILAASHFLASPLKGLHAEENNGNLFPLFIAPAISLILQLITGKVVDSRSLPDTFRAWNHAFRRVTGMTLVEIALPFAMIMRGESLPFWLCIGMTLLGTLASILPDSIAIKKAGARSGRLFEGSSSNETIDTGPGAGIAPYNGA